MKTFGLSMLCASLALLTGCAANRSPLTLNMVGPAPAMQPEMEHSPHGTLLVFSAFETSSLGASSFDDIRPHTEYTIYRQDGTVLQKVPNRTGAFGEDPAAVELPPGVYRVIAKSNGYGAVTVPVRIEDRKVTNLHLDSDASASRDSNNEVKLPDGQVVGWSANT